MHSYILDSMLYGIHDDAELEAIFERMEREETKRRKAFIKSLNTSDATLIVEPLDDAMIPVEYKTA